MGWTAAGQLRRPSTFPFNTMPQSHDKIPLQFMQNPDRPTQTREHKIANKSPNGSAHNGTFKTLK